MKIEEHRIRSIIRRELQHEGVRLDEQGIFAALKSLVGALFGNLGKEMTGTTSEYRSTMAATAQESTQAAQEALGRKEAKSWEDLKPHDDNVDKATWAIAVMAGLHDLRLNARMTDAIALQSISPSSEEEAEEWEKGEDANRLKNIYKGIGEAKGLLEWLGTHLNSAKTLAGELDEDVPLEELLQKVAEVGDYLAGDLAKGLESAASAVDKAEGYDGFAGDVSSVVGQAENITSGALAAVKRVKELKEKAEEQAKAAEETAAPDKGMPEMLLRKYVRTLLS